MKIKVVIVDDESRARSVLRGFCELYFSGIIEVVEDCNSVATAVRSIKFINPT